MTTSMKLKRAIARKANQAKAQTEAEQAENKAEESKAAADSASADAEVTEATDAAVDETGAGIYEAGDDAAVAKGRRGSFVPAGAKTLSVLALAAVVLAAAVVFLWMKDRGLKAEERASKQAVHAASLASRDLSSYDYRTLESDFRTARNQTTGKLRSEYSALAEQIRATAIQQQAISQTTVIKAGAEDVTAERVSVIVFANRSATTTSSQNRLPESLRIRVIMVKVGDRWLASELQVL